MASIVGLENVHYAILSKDDNTGVTYEAPKRLAPAITATVSTEVSTEVQYADNKAVESASSVAGTELELELASLSNDVLADLLGLEKNADGVIEYTSNYNAPYVAILFEGTKSDGSKRMVALYKGQFAIPEDSFETKGDGITHQSKTITGTFVSRTNDGKFKAQVDSDDAGVNATVIADWYTAVYNGVVAP